MNKYIAENISSLTGSLRFEGANILTDLSEIQTNSVPYHRFQFLLTSYVTSPGYIYNIYTDPQELSIGEISQNVLKKENMLVKCDPDLGQYMNMNLIYRGNVDRKEVNAFISRVKTQRIIKFVDWCPGSVRYGINYYQPPPMNILNNNNNITPKITRSVFMLANSTSIRELFTRNTKIFDALYAKRAYVHHFISEGMEEEEFIHARDNVADLISEYLQAVMEQQEDEELH